MRVFSNYPFLSRLLILIILPIISLILVLHFFLYKSQALSNTQIYSEHITSKVEIAKDNFGVPVISSKNDLDVYFGLGVAHAQDRLWQMEMNRRIGAGRLSEVMGSETLSSDIFMRTMGLYKKAKDILSQLPERERVILERYVKGVNYGIKALPVLPPEFLIYKYSPEPWKAEDSLVWMQLMTWQLSSNYGFELHRALLVQALGVEKANLLLPKVDLTEEEKNNIASSPLLINNLIPKENITQHLPKPFIGSNSWVVSGKHTSSGKPIVANDPHLSNSTPSVWYLANLKGSDLDVQGATFPGLPFVVIGRNKYISWGMTNMLADTQDIFIERLNTLNKDQYEVDGKWLDMDIEYEKIEIKKDFLRRQPEPFNLKIRRTIHGPIISDVSSVMPDSAYSLRWTGDDQSSGTFSAFLELNYVKNWSEFKDSLSTYVAPIHNFIYADKEGNIGYYAPGLFPIRGNGTGAYPTVGWESKNNWKGWIEKDDYPSILNPDSGFIVTANNNVMGESYPYHLTFDWAPDYRAKRISSALSKLIENKSGKITSEDMIALQSDNLTPVANSVLPYLLKLEPTNQRQKAAIDNLKLWDGKMDRNSISPSIYAAWLSNIYKLLIEDDIEFAQFSPAALNSLAVATNNLHLPLIEDVINGKDKSDICDYKRTEKQESCDEIIMIALEHGLNDLKKRLGSDDSSWQWGNIHKKQMPHFPMSDYDVAPSTPFTEDSIFHFLFHREVGNSGGDETVDVAPYSVGDSSMFLQFFGTGYKQVIDMDYKSPGNFILTPGQSGNPISTHYDDLISPHVEGQYLNMESKLKNTLLIINPVERLEELH